MTIIEELMDAAKADVSVLKSLDSQGDDFTRFRDVDFLIEAPSKENAELICGFINDFNYGLASVEGERDGVYFVEVIVNMPVTQNIISSVSGFMVCVASLFEGSLNGWGCCAQVTE